MKIDSSSVSLAASHQSLISHERTESLRAWRGNRRPDFESATRANTNEISISQSARMALAVDIQALGARAAPQVASPSAGTSDLAAAIEASDEAVKNDPFLSMIKSMIEFLTGRPVKTYSAADLQPSDSPNVDAPHEAPRQSPAASPGQPPARAGFGVEYDKHEVYQEIEATSFSAQGVIHTQDGQQISFKLDLQMERSYREETNVSIRAGDAVPVRKDPLVVNFAGTAAQLVDQHFRFDLNNDGQQEDLPMLASGSGYLAFDRNGNGRIDAGNELFGPATNNGFAELAKLDSDGNGWLDESDPLFKRLGIWRPSNGDTSTNAATAQLSSLAENGIGALGLMHLATPFELRSSGNRDLGAVSATGIAVTNDSKILSLQEIDLTAA